MQTNTHEPFSLTNRTEDSRLDAAAATISREFQHFIGDLESLIKSATSDDKNAFETAGDNIQARARALKQRFDLMSDSVQASACSSAKSADVFAHQRPWALAGMGVCLGILAGIALRRH